MLKKILIGFVAVLAAFLIYASIQPSDYKIQRSIVISAAPKAVFTHVNDLGKWQAWSPWEKLDPAMKRTFEGPKAGPGAIYRWVGNNQVGEGSMTITESKPGELVRIKLEFLKPFKDSSDTEFTFTPEGKKTLVAWSMTGKNNFMSKIFCVFMDMDKMVGGQFEKGLADMKTAAETKK
jgi:hypothetical protein